jgi:mono/diheme cytochrome c family protein
MPFPALKPPPCETLHEPGRGRSATAFAPHGNARHLRIRSISALNLTASLTEAARLAKKAQICLLIVENVQEHPPFRPSSHSNIQAMQTFKTILIALAATLFVAPSAFAIDNNETATGDAAYGRRWCSSCHQVTADQQRSKAGAPPFTTIAQSPGFNGDRLARLMLSPHPNMAKLALSRTAVDDIAAYILSLKK